MTTPTDSAVSRFPASSAKPYAHAAMTSSLRPALDAPVRTLTTAVAGKLVYYVDHRPGTRPLVLLHSINAAASSYEMKPFFDAFRGERTVYALDLPGFGLSARDERAYDRETYRGALRRFLVDVADVGGASPLAGVDLVALSLSSEHAAAIAVEDPALLHSLVLVSPTGLAAKGRGPSPALDRLATFPLLSSALYRLVASRPSLSFFLRKSFVGAVDEGLLAYSRATVRERGAERAPLAFLRGEPFTPEIFTEAYLRLQTPTLVVYDEDAYTSFDRLGELVKQNAHVKSARIVPSRGLPQFEAWGAVENAIRQFWARETDRA
jgi:pimeloyl-ACP methyl ester carboxylesterase